MARELPVCHSIARPLKNEIPGISYISALEANACANRNVISALQISCCQRHPVIHSALMHPMGQYVTTELRRISNDTVNIYCLAQCDRVSTITLSFHACIYESGSADCNISVTKYKIVHCKWTSNPVRHLSASAYWYTDLTLFQRPTRPTSPTSNSFLVSQ